MLLRNTGSIWETLSIRSRFPADNAEIPVTVIYGPARPGELHERTHSYCGRQRHTPQQGPTGCADLRSDQVSSSALQDIDYRDTWREAFITGQKGIVRTPDRWGLRSSGSLSLQRRLNAALESSYSYAADAASEAVHLPDGQRPEWLVTLAASTLNTKSR